MHSSAGAGELVRTNNKRIAYTIDPDRRLIVLTNVGEVRVDDVRQLHDLARLDTTFDPTFSALLDFSRADVSGLTSADIERVAGTMLVSPAARRAAVVSSTVNSVSTRAMNEGQFRNRALAVGTPAAGRLFMVRTVAGAHQWPSLRTTLKPS